MAGRLGPVQLDVLDGHGAGDGVAERDCSVCADFRDQVVVAEGFVGDLLVDFGLLGGAAGDGGQDDGRRGDDSGDEVEEVVRDFHKVVFYVSLSKVSTHFPPMQTFRPTNVRVAAFSV